MPHTDGIGEHPYRDHDREVEWRDARHDAERLADLVDIDAAAALFGESAFEQGGNAAERTYQPLVVLRRIEVAMVTIEIPDILAEVYGEEARARGMTLQEWILEAASCMPVRVAEPPDEDPEEWVRRFEEWVESHDPNLPVLSDEAMSRESIYKS